MAIAVETTTSARNLEDVMWQKFVRGLAATSVGKGLDPKAVMPTSGLTQANWEVMDITGLPSNSANPAAKGSMIVPALEQWADVMPTWAPNYMPSSLDFHDQYSAFLNSIELSGGNAALQQIADGYATNVTTARSKLSADRMQVFTDWSAFNTAQAGIPPSAQTDYQSWYNSTWASTILNDENQVKAQTAKYRQALAAVGGPDYQTIVTAQDRANLSAPSGNALVYNGVTYPGYSVTPGLNDWYLSALQTLTNGSTPAIDIELSADDDNMSGTEDSSYAGGGASVSYSAFLWSGSASASYQQSKGAQSHDSLVQGMKIKYTAQAASMFTFSPARWYDSAMVSAFHDHISPNSAFANKPLFGAGGLLNIWSKQVIVVLKPSVTITGDKTKIASLSNQFQQSSAASISVGAFCWSASANAAQGQSHYDTDVKVSSDGTSITMTDNTNSPKVIAVIPTKLG